MKEQAVRILESCGFNAEIGLSALEHKSLITISEQLGFHDHIEEMGWNIVRRLHPTEPTRHSRLWFTKEIEKILVNKSGSEATKSIRMMGVHMDRKIMIEGLKNMKELRLVYIQDVDVRYWSRKNKNDRTSIYIPDALQSLHWHGYPFWYLVITFKANRFWSGISQLLELRERKVHNNLKFIDLSYSSLKTFDLGMTPHLEELNLNRCEDFVEIILPVKCPNLKVLNLSRSKVSNLNLGMIPHLERLYLEYCSHLKEIHAPVGCLKKLVYFCLNVQYFKVDKQHESASLIDAVEIDVSCLYVCPLHATNDSPWFRFTCIYDEPRSSWSGNLEKLFGFGPCVCENLEYFLATICDLQHLRELTLDESNPNVLWPFESLWKLPLIRQEFQRLPESIFMLKNLKSLQLRCFWALGQLPENICRLECLEDLMLYSCKSLRDVPNSICKMKCLKRLKLTCCLKIKKMPEELGNLRCLKELWIEDTDINRLPQSIYQLKGLRIYGSRVQLESYGFTSILENEKSEYYVEL